MTTAYSTLLGLALPVQGELSGTWGDMVDNGITRYVDIAVAGTVTLTNDGAVTLSLTNGDSSATNIVSSLTGAGTVSAQFAIIKVTGTLTTAKVLTPPSSSRTYVVVNAATGSTVTVKASGQTGVSIAVGETAFVYFNGTDYVKVAGTVNTGVTSFQTSLSGLTPSTATTGAVTLAGTLGTANGGTGLTSFTSGGVVYASSTSALATGSALTFDGTNLFTTGSLLLGGVSSTGSLGEIGLANSKAIRFRNGANNAYLNAMYVDASNDLHLGAGTSDAIIEVFGLGEAMRIKSTSGNVGIGTSSPAYKLEVAVGTSGQQSLASFRTADTTTANNAGIQIFATPSSTATSRSTYIMWDADGANAGGSDYFYIQKLGNSGQVDFIQQSNAAMTFQTAGAERARIDSSGNVGIGTSSPGQVLDIQKSQAWATLTSTTGTLSSLFKSSNTGGSSYFGRDNSTGGVLGSAAYATVVYGSGAYPMTFHTNDTERARISAAGGFSVGTTADPGAGAIYATGNITAYYSDARLKTVSGKIENALDKVAQLSGVYYTNNDIAKSFGYENDEEQVGVLAQDVEAVLPQIVKAAPFDLDENNNSKSGENYKTVQYERLVPLLIEAINELQAKVKALEAK